MITPAQAALMRRAQDVAGGPISGPAETRAEAARTAAPRQAALPPPLAEGQYEPQPSSMRFSDFLSGLNPLQHLPVVGMIYRAITGDVPPTVMRVAGSFLLGGPVGAIATAVAAAGEEIFSRSLGSSSAAQEQPAGSGDPAGARLAEGVPAGFRSIRAPEDAGERLLRLREAGALYSRRPLPAALPLPMDSDQAALVHDRTG